MIRRVAVFAAALGLSLVGSQLVWAQGRQQAPKGSPIKVDGTVESVQAGGLVVNGKDGKKYGVGFPQTAKITMSGNASPDVLKSGMYVQFTVTLDDKKKPTSEATKIQIIEPSNISQPGVFSEKGPDGKPGEPGPFFVRGTVKSFRDGTLNISAGTTAIAVTVPSSASIPVTVSEWQLASPGDTITGDGSAFPAQQGIIPVAGERIEIKAIAPITGKKKK
jgi:hypothetical protein